MKFDVNSAQAIEQKISKKEFPVKEDVYEITIEKYKKYREDIIVSKKQKNGYMYFLIEHKDGKNIIVCVKCSSINQETWNVRSFIINLNESFFKERALPVSIIVKFKPSNKEEEDWKNKECKKSFEETKRKSYKIGDILLCKREDKYFYIVVDKNSLDKTINENYYYYAVMKDIKEVKDVFNGDIPKEIPISKSGQYAFLKKGGYLKIFDILKLESVEKIN